MTSLVLSSLRRLASNDTKIFFRTKFDAHDSSVRQLIFGRGGGVEDHDYRVIEARAALAEARKREPGELAPEELREEITRFRKYVRWLIDLADDAADTEYDEEVSQVMIYGGIYVAPADTVKLCDGCTKTLDLIWEGQQCPASVSADSAA
jgi:hypothetical protein